MFIILYFILFLLNRCEFNESFKYNSFLPHQLSQKSMNIIKMASNTAPNERNVIGKTDDSLRKISFPELLVIIIIMIIIIIIIDSKQSRLFYCIKTNCWTRITIKFGCNQFLFLWNRSDSQY